MTSQAKTRAAKWIWMAKGMSMWIAHPVQSRSACGYYYEKHAEEVVLHMCIAWSCLNCHPCGSCFQRSVLTILNKASSQKSKGLWTKRNVGFAYLEVSAVSPADTHRFNMPSFAHSRSQNNVSDTPSALNAMNQRSKLLQSVAIRLRSNSIPRGMMIILTLYKSGFGMIQPRYHHWGYLVPQYPSIRLLSAVVSGVGTRAQKPPAQQTSQGASKFSLACPQVRQWGFPMNCHLGAWILCGNSIPSRDQQGSLRFSPCTRSMMCTFPVPPWPPQEHD